MIKDFKIDAFSRPVSDLSDSPEISAGELKAHFDSNSYELLESLNGLIDYLGGDDALGEMKISGKSLYELLEQKVSKEAGKGLSTNDFTNEEKEKLAGLENIENTIPELDYADIDDITLSKGFYKLINLPREDAGTETDADSFYADEGSIVAYPTEELLFISQYQYQSAIDQDSNEYGILQVRHRGDGTILRRIRSEHETNWSNWAEAINDVEDDLAMHFKGEIEEASLPTEGNTKGDVYKLKTGDTEERVYAFGKIYNWGEEIGNRFSWLEDLLTVEEQSLIYDSNVPLTLSIDIYSANWEYITTISDIYLDRAYTEWTADSYIDNLPEGLENDVTYCFVRTNPITPWNANASKQIFPIDSKIPANMYADYAIYNGETFDKFYGADKINEKNSNGVNSSINRMLYGVRLSDFGYEFYDDVYAEAEYAADMVRSELLYRIERIETELDEIKALQNS